MSRLILIPQYPTTLRYQEWWYEEFPERYSEYFDEVKVLGSSVGSEVKELTAFAPRYTSIQFEVRQIKHYMNLALQDDDILLLNDLSFPGLFPHVLLHKRPKKCFAICHGTSKNAHDYYQENRHIKYPIEKSVAKLFDGIFVATNYHKDKLKWSNVEVVPFPNPPIEAAVIGPKTKEIISLSRPGIQKHNTKFEKALKREGLQIEYPECKTWAEYYDTLRSSSICLITSKEETYGYLAIEAIMHGCIPVAPKAFSYPELIPEEYLYEPTSVGKCLEIIHEIMTGTLQCPPLLTFARAEKFYEITANLMQNV